jgi:hypothetical protein
MQETTGLRDATEEEKRKICCSARGCKGVPLRVETTSIQRVGRQVTRTRYLCPLHLPKVGKCLKPVYPQESGIEALDCELPKKPWLCRLLDWL